MFSEIWLGEPNQFMIKIFRQISLRKYHTQSIPVFGEIFFRIGKKTHNISKKEFIFTASYFFADLRY